MLALRRTALPVLALLATATVSHGVAFAQKADSCAMVRRPAAERLGCCALAGVERITREGGDCCKTLTLGEGEDALQGPVAVEVAPAALAVLPRPLVVPRGPASTSAAPARARAPPPRLWRPTDTTRLLL